ncbi:MAG: hypothetical protein IJ035_04420 [Oscillospiraceae bacterium]|nr:hypothetical protein [Oscillospiraceae bacterium]
MEKIMGFQRGLRTLWQGSRGQRPQVAARKRRNLTCANVLRSKTWKQKLAFVFRSAALKAHLKGEFWGGKPQKRKFSAKNQSKF